MPVNGPTMDAKLLEFLKNRLPFSINMLHSMKNYPQQTDLLIRGDKGDPEAVLVNLRSGYNDHIWHDPIMWVTGNKNACSDLVNSLDMETCVLISDTGLKEDLQEKYDHLNSYNEYLMVLHKDDLSEEALFSKRLDEDNAADSLSLAGILPSYPNYSDYIEKEKRFLKDRQVFGIFYGERMIARGALMSNEPEYSSVGAFIVDPEFRSRGFGEQIVTSVAQQAALKSERICLFVNTNNEPAISLYKKIGFSVAQEIYFYDVNTGLRP